MIKAIMVAVSSNGVIGKNNDLVWHLPADLKHFKETTSGHYVIMGRKTYESMGTPLVKRLNVVVTRNPQYFVEGVVVMPGLEQAIKFAESQGQEMAFILGGGNIYQQAMPLVDRLYITEVHAGFDGDTFFPKIDPEKWQETQRKDFDADELNQYPYSFVEYRRP